MNGKTLCGSVLKVSLARRQPVYNPEKSTSELAHTLSTPEAWSAIASNSSDSVENPKKRAVISYDDDDFYANEI